jgi:hypothetical protein
MCHPHKSHNFSLYHIIACYSVTVDRVLDWILEFLTTYTLTTRDYSLQITVTQAKSFPALSVFTSNCLVTAHTMAIPLILSEWRFPSNSEFLKMLQLCYDRRSVGQSILASSTDLGLKTRFLFLSDSCGFVDVGRSLWREDGSDFYNVQCAIYLHDAWCVKRSRVPG